MSSAAWASIFRKPPQNKSQDVLSVLDLTQGPEKEHIDLSSLPSESPTTPDVELGSAKRPSERYRMGSRWPTRDEHGLNVSFGPSESLKKKTATRIGEYGKWKPPVLAPKRETKYLRRNEEPSTSRLWVNEFAPRRAKDIVGKRNKCNAALLKQWMNIVASRTEDVQMTRDKRRKTAHDDDFIVNDEDAYVNDTWYVTEDTHIGPGSLTNMMLLTGPSGSGKTASVYAVAKELDLTVVEVNAGEAGGRSAREMEKALGDLTGNHTVHQRQQRPANEDSPRKRRTGLGTFFMSIDSDKNHDAHQSKPAKYEQKNAVMLIDEADVLFSNDYDFWLGVRSLASRSQRPLVLTCNDVTYIPDGLPLQLCTVNGQECSWLNYERPKSDEMHSLLERLGSWHNPSFTSTSQWPTSVDGPNAYLTTPCEFPQDTSVRQMMHQAQFEDLVFEEKEDNQDTEDGALRDPFERAEFMSYYHSFMQNDWECLLAEEPDLQDENVTNAYIRLENPLRDKEAKELLVQNASLPVSGVDENVPSLWDSETYLNIRELAIALVAPPGIPLWRVYPAEGIYMDYIPYVCLLRSLEILLGEPSAPWRQRRSMRLSRGDESRWSEAVCALIEKVRYREIEN